MDIRLQKYASLLVETGLNLQKGQTLVISALVETAPFVRLCASRAYDLGCREVVVKWADEFLTREKYLRAQDSVFDEIPDWFSSFHNDYSESGAAWLAIDASDPEALRGVDPERLRRWSVAVGKALEPYRRRQMTNFFPWCVASVPTEAWARKVFPDRSGEEAVSMLWDAILKTVRVSAEESPEKLWSAHRARLKELRERLTEYRFKSLHYKNSLGTDLVVENHLWEGGDEKTADGRLFCANMPTEEVFSAPRRDGVNGTVCASKPLVLGGNIVKGIKLELQNGKIVKADAETGLEFLESELNVDEGARYLGEIALVPYDSPISNSGILFFNTLFDENASCHFAFGEAYPCVEGGQSMTPEELKAAGLNSSITHVDFMVGTPDLSIVGTTSDGREIPVFVDGNFAF